MTLLLFVCEVTELVICPDLPGLPVVMLPLMFVCKVGISAILAIVLCGLCVKGKWWSVKKYGLRKFEAF